MVGHEEAVLSAYRLADYCNNHFKQKTPCSKCVFKPSIDHRCQVELFLGNFGEELKEMATDLTNKRLKELTQNENS